MPKPFKTPTQQITHLQTNKLIHFNDLKLSKKLLIDNNYYNVISCGKVRFATGVNDNFHTYDESNFNDWIAYFELDRKISNHLMQNILKLELVINSRTAHYVAELMETAKLTEFENEAIMQIIKARKEVAGINFKNYNGFETWTFITKMMFNDMKKLVFWLLENKYDYFLKIVDGYTFLQTDDHYMIRRRLNEIHNLRNSLFHFTPLNIYLVYGKEIKGRLRNDEKIKVAVWLYRLGGNQKGMVDLKAIIGHTKRFIRIKNKK